MDSQTNTLLQIMAAAGKLGASSLSRTAIVKLVYLSEMLRPTYELWLRSYTYDRYNYGPYSDEVFRRLDFLIFHGLVDVKMFQKNKGRTRATYAINNEGIEKASLFAEQPEGILIRSLAEDLIWGLQTLGIETAGDFCRLVYSEPGFEYTTQKAERKGQQRSVRFTLPDVHTYQHPSFRLQAVIGVFHQDRVGDKTTPRDLVRTYLNFLASRSRRGDVIRRASGNEKE